MNENIAELHGHHTALISPQGFLLHQQLSVITK